MGGGRRAQRAARRSSTTSIARWPPTAPPEAQPYKAGLELIQRQLAELLKKRGVTTIEALGADFDPHLHQAVAYEEVAGRARGRSGRRDGQGLQAGRSPAASGARQGGEGIVSKRDYYEILEVSRTATDQEIKSCVSQAGAEVPPRSQPGRQERRRKVQGSRRGLRHSQRRRQARALRSLRSRRRRRRRQGFDPSQFTGFEDIFGGLGDIFGFGGGGRRAGPAARRRSALRPRDQVRAVGEGRRNHIQIPRHETCETCKGNGAAPGIVADHVPAVPRHRSAALSAGLLHRGAHLRPMPRRRQGDRQAVSDLPRRRHHRADAQAHREDPGGHRHRPALAPDRRRRRRHARRPSRRSLRRHLRARARVLPA